LIPRNWNKRDLEKSLVLDPKKNGVEIKRDLNVWGKSKGVELVTTGTEKRKKPCSPRKR